MSPEIFSLAHTAKAVHDTLDEAFAAIPDDRSHVVIIDGTYAKDDGAGARFVYAQRLDHGWNVEVDAAYDKPHGISGRVATMRSW